MSYIKRPKGTNDILPKDIQIWKNIEQKFEEICRNYGYYEIRTPILEFTSLFQRGVGDSTDIVKKEMFNIERKSDIDKNQSEQLSLKPEGTASVIRAAIENSLNSNLQMLKLFYNTPCFRYERPQKGRLREFHQLGVEVFGSYNPFTDAEVISLAYNFFKALGIENHIQLKINSIGTVESRKKYYDNLRNFIKPNLDNLCNDCIERYEKNPMRILDCKNENCQKYVKSAPLMIDFLDEDSKSDYKKLKDYLDILEIPYEEDHYIVRGLDYYVKTAFEFVSNKLGAQSTVCGGGRYDNLFNKLGGSDVPGVGFAIGIERLIILLNELNCFDKKEDKIDTFIISIGDISQSIAIKMLKELRENGISADIDHLSKSFKAQMKYANKINVKNVIIVGEDEIKNNTFVLKNMDNSTQKILSLDKFIDNYKENMGV